ncbi:TetR/AcrR family transcriptional regulator [Frankia sp. AgKG'84/4]|uniref:TetR/AcrR family transcriptional regulator n=1 Tax=Frankia sp. AgKG'84/4 TaxID=573490 RepID=UPI00200C7108|nr:TetR/AcrR family transcriptional regulator [Frankia sp. AgKG'84/4]MCL9796688.1 TetR/AcrR family transcriptional regulator [Frankia sp. AgKG'84/4]
MPKVVDREARRRAVAGGLLRLAARDGLEAVSVRSVAVECGISPGAVQKLFPSKEDMILRALELTEERLASRYASLADDAGLDAHLRQALPLDEQRREEVIMIIAFSARAAGRPDWGKLLAEGYRTIQDATAELLRRAQRDGLLDADRDAADLAAGLVALSDGFAARLLHLPPDSAEAHGLLRALDASVRALLGITSAGTPPATPGG